MKLDNPDCTNRITLFMSKNYYRIKEKESIDSRVSFVLYNKFQSKRYIQPRERDNDTRKPMPVQSRPSGEGDLGARREIYWIEISNRQTKGKARKQLPSFREDQHEPKFNSVPSPASPEALDLEKSVGFETLFFFFFCTRLLFPDRYPA